MSLYIPFVHASVSFETLAETFLRAYIGAVRRIEWTENAADPRHKSCFVYLDFIESPETDRLRAAMCAKEPFRIDLDLIGLPERFLKIYENISVAAKHPVYEHVDLVVAVPKTTPIEDVYAQFDMENLGKIAGHRLADIDATDLLPHGVDPDTEYHRVTMVFAYWLRSPSAVAFRESLANTGEARVIVRPAELVHWRVRESPAPPALTGTSPYIWLNPRAARQPRAADSEM
jgi:hypothetical protein